MSNLENFLIELEGLSSKYGYWINKNETNGRSDLVNNEIEVIATDLHFNGEIQSYCVQEIKKKTFADDIVVKKDYIAIHCYEGSHYSTSKKCKDFKEAFDFLIQRGKKGKYQELFLHLDYPLKEDEASTFFDKAKNELSLLSSPDEEIFTQFLYEEYKKPVHNPTNF
ncbi:hypothetical protein MZM54_00200 [[Brevibacterium] frigoritolerans]|nr:hypothetical protein [Peribacillus frigoritolerans]